METPQYIVNASLCITKYFLSAQYSTLDTKQIGITVLSGYIYIKTTPVPLLDVLHNNLTGKWESKWTIILSDAKSPLQTKNSFPYLRVYFKILLFFNKLYSGSKIAARCGTNFAW